MNIKRMMAGFTAAALMLGTLSTTCFAASAENDDSKKDPAAVTEGAATDTGKTEECLSLIKSVLVKVPSVWEVFQKQFADQLNRIYSDAMDFKGFLVNATSDVISLYT